MRILEATGTPGGAQDVRVLTLALGSGQSYTVFRAKWRSLGSGDIINEPRKELAAYAVQKLVLEPADYVVPPTAGHCFDIEEYRALVDARAAPTFAGCDCVFGFLSYWLGDVMDLKTAREQGILSTSEGPLGGAGLFDAGLFHSDPFYRRSVANLNVVTFLIHHADSHAGQFLLTEPPIHVYSVDNSIAFESIKNPLLLVRDDWSRLEVPAIPRDVAEGLTQLEPDALRALHTIERYELGSGVLERRPATPDDLEAHDGVEWTRGVLRIGLTRREVDGVDARIAELARRLVHAELGVF